MTEKNGRKASGVVIGDPLKDAPIGAKFDLRFMLCPPIIDAGAGDLKEWDFFGGIVGALGFKRGNSFNVEGSVVFIGPGLALTAKHVIEPHMGALIAGDTAPIVTSVTGYGLDLWRIHQIVYNDTDVAILRVELISELPQTGSLLSATMTTREPKIGERVMLVGFRQTSVELDTGEVAGETRIAVGEVSEIYQDGRDRTFLPHACLAVRCLTMGGMSGGPAFDESGKLIGILTSSIEHEQGPSNVSLIWPILGNDIQTCWPNGIIECPYTLLDLAKKMPNLEKPEAVFRDDGGVWTYRPWS
jgi:S1-C subfamily serine protease